MIFWYTFFFLSLLGLLIGIYLFSKLIEPISKEKALEGDRDPVREFYLEWIFLQKLIPRTSAKQRQRVQLRFLLIILLSIGQCFLWICSWKFGHSAWPMKNIIIVSVVCGFMLAIGVLGLYSVISRGRIEEKLIALSVPRASSSDSIAKWHFAIIWGGLLLPQLVFVNLDSLSYLKLLNSPLFPFLLIFIPSVISLCQKYYLCSDGISAGISFFTWGEIAWCRWYPDRKAVMIGVNEKCPFGSWFVVELSDLVRERYLPLLREKLADKEIASVAEVLGLEKPPDSENLSDQPKWPHLAERN